MKSTDLSAQTPGTIGAAPGMEIMPQVPIRAFKKPKMPEHEKKKPW